MCVDSPKISISDHCVERFRHHTKTKKSDAEIRSKIYEMFMRSKETSFLRPHKVALAILRYDFIVATYHRMASWIMVVVDNEIKTIYEDKVHRFK